MKTLILIVLISTQAMANKISDEERIEQIETVKKNLPKGYFTPEMKAEYSRLKARINAPKTDKPFRIIIPE